MFFKKFFLSFCLILGLSISLQAAQTTNINDSNNQKLQAYMQKGKLYEQDQRAKLASMSRKKNGFFVGVLLGNFAINTKPIEQKKSQDSQVLLYGARVGYQKYLKNYTAGLRFYGEYLRGGDIQQIPYQLGSINLDLIADIPLDDDKEYAIGVFGGIGMGWMNYTDKIVRPSFYQLGTTVNLGVALTLNIRHRIELELKIPPIKLKDTSLYNFSTTNLYFVSYNFLF